MTTIFLFQMMKKKWVIMVKNKNRFYPGIQNAEDLGNAHLGNPNTAIVPPKRRIDRAEYGRRLAEAEDGIFTPSGYLIPMKKRRNRDYEE